jgi:hypothetical protein
VGGHSRSRLAKEVKLEMAVIHTFQMEPPPGDVDPEAHDLIETTEGAFVLRYVGPETDRLEDRKAATKLLEDGIPFANLRILRIDGTVWQTGEGAPG